METAQYIGKMVTNVLAKLMKTFAMESRQLLQDQKLLENFSGVLNMKIINLFMVTFYLNRYYLDLGIFYL